jgi:hypothetical protein
MKEAFALKDSLVFMDIHSRPRRARVPDDGRAQWRDEGYVAQQDGENLI